MLLEKLNFNARVSEVQQRYETTQEQLDVKTQKYKDLKQEHTRFKEEGQDKDVGNARLKEEIQIHIQQKAEAEGKLKKFEQKFRSALRESEELRE